MQKLLQFVFALIRACHIRGVEHEVIERGSDLPGTGLTLDHL